MIWVADAACGFPTIHCYWRSLSTSSAADFRGQEWLQFPTQIQFSLYRQTTLVGKFLACPLKNLQTKKPSFEEVWKKLTLNWTQTLISDGTSLPQKRINRKKLNYCFQPLLEFCVLRKKFPRPILVLKENQIFHISKCYA